VTVSIRRQFRLDRRRTRHFLDELRATSSGLARTVYLPKGVSSSEVESAWRDAVGPEPLPLELKKMAAASGSGSVLFWGETARYLIVPPFPLPGKDVQSGYAVDTLVGLLEQDFTVALILVRLGAYAIALCRDEAAIKSKVGTGLVHGRHRKGGSSQQRFQRHREKQTEQFLIRVCHHVSELLEPDTGVPDYLVYGGAWTTLLSLQKRCAFLKKFSSQILSPLLDIPKPDREVLDAAARRVWASTVIELKEPAFDADN
jgi:hypothetical protein